MPSSIGAMPNQRQDRRHRPSHNPPNETRASALAGQAGMTETAPGRLETQRPIASMISIPKPSTRNGQASRPNGIRATDIAAAGMATNPITGMASKLPSTA